MLRRTRRRRADGTIARHPPWTDFPVGLWIASFVFDLASLQLGNPLVRVAFYNMVLGCVLALAAVLFGVLDYNKIPDGHPARRLGLIHAGLNATAFVLFAVNLVWRAQHLDAMRTPAGMVILSAIAVAIVSVSGWLGGKMTFEQGANVRSAEAGEEFVRERVRT